MSPINKVSIIIFNQLLLFLFISTVNAASLPVRQELIKMADAKKGGQYTFSRCRSLQRKNFTDNGQKKVLIIGDSQACDFLNSMLENGYFRRHQIRVRYIPYQCQPVLSSNISQFIHPKDRAFCLKKFDNLEQARQQISEANLVIFAARWKLKTAQALPQTIKHLGLKANQKVVVIGNNNYGRIRIREYIHMPDNKLRTLRNKIDKKEQEINTILKKVLKGRTLFVDQHQLICGALETCPLFIGLKLISYDGRHLTKMGARYVGKILYQRSRLRQLF